MKQRFPLRRASSLWLGAAMTLFCLLCSSAWAQTGVYSYGHPTLNEGGIILAESPGRGIYVGGYRGDSSLIMLVDYNGVLINELTFKVSPPVVGQRDMMTDFKFDVVNNQMVGTGVILNAAGNSGGYVFEFDPGTFTLNWVTIFPVLLGSNFMPLSVQDLGVGFNEYRVYGSGNNSAYSVHVLVNKGGGFPGPYTFYTGPGPNDFAATAQSPAGTVYTTSRWGHTAAVADFRPSVIQLNALGGLVNANRFTYMHLWPNAVARLFSRDVILSQQFPVTVGMGDFNGTNLNIARAFWSIHDVNTLQTDGYEINLPNFTWEDAEEVFLEPGISTNPRYIVFGEGSTTSSGGAAANQLWMMSMNPNGTFNWAFSYGGIDREFTSYLPHAQQQCIPINSGTARIAFTATTRSYSGSDDILLVLTNAVGDFDTPDQPCINSRITPTFIQRMRNNPLQVSQPILQIANTFVNPPLRDPNLTPSIVCGPVPVVTTKLGSGTLTDTGFTLYPNPATGQVQVAYALAPRETATLRVLDATGRILLSTNLDAEASTTTLDIRNLTAGMYFVSLIGERGAPQSAKLIVR